MRHLILEHYKAFPVSRLDIPGLGNVLCGDCCECIWNCPNPSESPTHSRISGILYNK